MAASTSGSVAAAHDCIEPAVAVAMFGVTSTVPESATNVSGIVTAIAMRGMKHSRARTVYSSFRCKRRSPRQSPARAHFTSTLRLGVGLHCRDQLPERPRAYRLHAEILEQRIQFTRGLELAILAAIDCGGLGSRELGEQPQILGHAPRQPARPEPQDPPFSGFA